MRNTQTGSGLFNFCESNQLIKKRMIYESLLLLSWTLQRELEQISVNKGAVLFTTFQLFFAVEMVILIEIHTIWNLMGGWKISLCVFCIDFSWSCKPRVTCWILCELWFIQSYTIEIYNRPFFACKIFTNVIMWMHLKRIVHWIAHPPCHSKSDFLYFHCINKNYYKSE